MASKTARSFLTNFALFLMFHVAVFVQGDQCPQQVGGPSTTNERAAKLSGTGEFQIYDRRKESKYTIKLCKRNAFETVAIGQEKTSTGLFYVVGWFNGSRVHGGTDYLMLEYFGRRYGYHCGSTRRKAIFYIQCDPSADTHSERTPKIIEEYRPNESVERDVEFCHYLFEMKHDAACSPPAKTKISPGSFVLIIVAMIGFLYLGLGFLYRRFIVKAKGMEQIPNYRMWREFVTLQADGWNYVCRCRRTRKPTHYSRVDDGTADDEEFYTVNNDGGDDAMLPL